MAQSAEELSDWVPPETFGSRLKRLRRALGWDQKQAAEACGLNEKTWGSWEAAGGSPRNMAEVVDKIHRATNVDREWLMWGETSARLFTNPDQGTLFTVHSQPESSVRPSKNVGSPLLNVVPDLPDSTTERL